MNTRLPIGVCVLLLATAPAPAADPPSSQTVVDALQPFVNAGTLAGAVTLVADRDNVLSLDAVGSADIAENKLLKTDALFWIASQSKPITAVALMMLVDANKVKLDDPVEKYLPEFRGQWLAVEQDADHVLLRKPKRPPTVRDLLRHTSGLPFQSAMEQPTLDGLRLRDAVHSYAITPLQFEPGSKYQYSNAGINTAGRIIEVVSGMTYEAFLTKRIFEPLGMTDTTFWPTEELLERLPKAYKPNASGTGLEETTIGQLRYPLHDTAHRYPMPAGGLFSTATDLGRFCQMMLNGGALDGMRYLSEPLVAEMTRKQTGDGIKEGYGLGWSVGSGTFGHGGAFATNMTIDPAHNRVTVFLVQHAGFPGNGGESHAAFLKAAERIEKPK